MKKNLQRLSVVLSTKGFVKMSGGLLASLVLGMGLPELLLPEAAHAAEEIQIIIGGPGLIYSVSVDSLETFAATGELSKDLRLLARILNDDALSTVRQSLQQPIPMTVQQVDHLGYSALGEDVLHNVGKVIQPKPGINGFHALRGAVIGAAAQAGPNGWTALDVLRQFPSQSIDIRLKDLLELRRVLDVYFRYNDAAIAAIQHQAQVEAGHEDPIAAGAVNDAQNDIQNGVQVAAASSPLGVGIGAGMDADSVLQSFTPRSSNSAEGLFEDLSQAGAYTFERTSLTLTNDAIRQTSRGIQTRYRFSVDAYVPQGLSAPAPVVIISHGFGDVQDSFAFVAEHLASHGYVVVLPNHVGSDLRVRERFLNGFVNTILSPSEFVSRPEEISFLIDEMEHWVETTEEGAALINPDQIGILGDSLGGSTALGLAGADISFSFLEDACNDNQLILNFSRYLQCQARFLPPQDRRLRDSRIKAAIASHPFGGSLYGPEGMGQIEVPLLMVSGSDDVVAPVVTEQIHPFVWTGSDQKYLAMLTEGTHFTAKPGRAGAEGFFSLITGEHRDIGSRYFKALSLAFWNAHLKGETDYLPYLSARYGHWLSQEEPLKLDIIQSLTPEALISAYGERPPLPIVPESSSPPPSSKDDPVLDQIERTGVLKVALRRDAAPFGYVDEDSEWVGYCRDFARDLQAYLAQAMRSRGQAMTVDLVELSSTVSDRFSLVEEGVAHVECGPNTIRQDVDGVLFSNPLWVAGPQFLVKQTDENRINPNVSLNGVRVAVLPNTTTEQFVQQTYPDADVIVFDSPTGRQDTIRALADGQVDAVVSDGILAISEVQRQNLEPSAFTLLPELPLSCGFYGLILPEADTEWQELVNEFLGDTHNIRLTRHLPEERLQEQVGLLDYCLNSSG